MKSLALSQMCVLMLTGFSAMAAERLSFNADWLFHKDDPPGIGDELSYAKLKPALLAPPTTENPGGDVEFVKPDFADKTWRSLNLPHDWGVEGPFDQSYPGETGKLPWWGVGWYRKHFTVPAGEADKRFYLDIDGAMSYAAVWLNGHFVGGWPYGYASFQLDLTPYIKPGENVLAIRLDNPKESSRWYPGGGIYRNVWLVKTAPVHIAHWGTYVTTTEVTPAKATIIIKSSVANNAATDTTVTVETRVWWLGPLSSLAAQPVSTTLTIPAGESASCETRLAVDHPRLWSVSTPDLYRVASVIEQDGKVLDVDHTTFGIRTIQFTADNGFLLNGQRVPIRGVCDHHDLGALGAAINTRGLERQLEILKEMGVNAIRTSHNPPAPEMLDLCDRMGIVVMDEFTDTWKAAKKKNGYALLFDDWADKDLRALIRRDRNHPCVVLWSTGNEIGEQGRVAGHAISRRLTDIVHEEDPTRPATAGCNNTQAGYNGFQKTIDVMGYNYKPREYQKFRDANPDQPLVGSETASTISSRGEYFFPVSEKKGDGKADFQMSSYDLYAPTWATTPDTEFTGQDKYPFVAGEFVWTGFDYLGEPTPYNSDMTNLLNFQDPAEKARAEQELKEIGKIKVPSRSSYFGIVDLAGFKKDRFYIYQARWRPDLPMAHILPHWNWPGREGEITPVHVYTSGDEAELFLNGKSLGRKKKGEFEYRLRWDDVKYAPGELKVVAYKDGKKWAQDIVKTTGPAAKLLLQSDRKTLKADGQDLAFVTVTIADAKGSLVPRSKNRVQFEVTGPAEIVATDNGDATDLESFQAKERKAYNGLCLVILRTKPGVPGAITLSSKSLGLQPARLTVRSVKP